MKVFSKILYAIIFIWLIPSFIFAIPPKLGNIEIQQPDGQKLTIRIVGNRDFHITTTENGIILTKDKDGFYRLADITSDGDIISSGIMASGNGEDKGIKLNAEIFRKLKVFRSRQTRDSSYSGIGTYKNNYPTTGNPKVPVILVEFQDVKFSDQYNAKEYFSNIIGGEGTIDFQAQQGSIKTYFKDQSHGVFIPEFDIYGPLTLPYPMEYYGSNEGIQDAFAHYMVSQSLKLLDPEVDFSQYDENKDGEIDFIYIIYAGYGENRGAGPEAIWPHAGYIKGEGDFVMVDNVWGNYYACSNELIFGNDEPEGICAFIHEYLHIIGLPDIYPTDSMVYTNDDWDYTAGQYTILDYGVYNNDGKTPPNLTAFERNALKWDEPLIFDTPLSISLEDISTGQFGLIPTEVPNEFYLLENRQKKGWDEPLPYHGLLIWHIDYDEYLFKNNMINNSRDHQHVELIKANNEILFGHPLSNQEGFPFPGCNNITEFTSATIPAMITWNNKHSQFPVTNIKEAEGIISFDIAGGEEQDSNVASILHDEDFYVIYNISGMKIGQGNKSLVENLPPGLYIINGKKVVVK